MKGVFNRSLHPIRTINLWLHSEAVSKARTAFTRMEKGERKKTIIIKFKSMLLTDKKVTGPLPVQQDISINDVLCNKSKRANPLLICISVTRSICLVITRLSPRLNLSWAIYNTRLRAVSRSELFLSNVDVSLVRLQQGIR